MNTPNGVITSTDNQCKAKGKIDKFTIDMLVNMLAKVHVSISLVINQVKSTIKGKIK